MRILVVSEGPAGSELAQLGHRVVVVPPSARRITLERMRHRPAVAYVKSASLRAPLALLALRVPYLLEIDRRLDASSGITAAVRGARGIVVPSEELGRFAVEELGARDAWVVPEGIDLARVRPGDRDEAKRKLSLQPGLRLVTMVGTLDDQLQLELLAEAHRRLTGTALLVAGDGPRADFVQAMRATTRPSSPVVFLGAPAREEAIAAIQAAHACVSVGEVGPSSLKYAACGRRQVLLRSEGTEWLETLYEPALSAVQIVDRSPVALRAALERAIEAEEESPLPAAAVARAREAIALRPAEQLAEVLEEAAGT